MNSVNQPTQVNVFFKVADPLHSAIIKTSQELQKRYGTDVALDDKLTLPHVSLYLFALPTKNLPSLLSKAEEMAGEMKPVNLTVKDVQATKSGGLMLEFEADNRLYQYHLKTLNAFNPLREGVQRQKYTLDANLKKLEHKHRQYLRRYGYRFILNFFTPHITVSYMDRVETAEKAQKEVKKLFLGQTTKTENLCILEDDYETGTAKKLIFQKKL